VPGGFELYNTDVYGAYEALATKPNLRTSTAAILGAGATARSVALAVLNSFPDLERLTVFSRSAEGANRIFEVLKRGGAFPNDSGLELIWNSIEAAADFGGAGLTVNTLPSDVAANVEIDLPFNESWFFDVTYNPWPSVLSSSWPADHTISGIEMLVNQAIAQLRIFATGDAAKALDNEEDVHKAMAAAVL
jgi:shikimate dehydrogenase